MAFRMPKTTLWPGENWHVSTPARQGVRVEALAEMARRLEVDFPPFAGMIVIRNGYRIFDAQNSKAKVGFAARLVGGALRTVAALTHSPQATFQDRSNGLWNTRSVTPSVLSLLVGIALKKGWIEDLDTPALNYLPETRSMELAEEKRQVSLRHLLTMSSGLRALDPKNGSSGLLFKRNWVKTCLELPVIAAPGSRLVYNAANAHLLSAILERASGQSTAEIARRYLLSPLGIQQFAWEADPQGVTFGGGNLFLRLEDMARIGYLVLREGVWDGEELIPNWYMTESTTKHLSMDYGFAYGYLWYLHEATWLDQPVRVISASGFGGQRIFIFPDLDLVAATVALSDFNLDRGHLVNQAVSDYLIPAVS